MPLLGMRSLSPYRILLSRSQHRPQAELYGVTLQQPLPSFPIPLKLDESEPLVLLQDVFNRVYERARYRTRINYCQPLPPPKLTAEEQDWVDKLLAPLRLQL
jgi:hypothetical protein